MPLISRNEERLSSTEQPGRRIFLSGFPLRKPNTLVGCHGDEFQVIAFWPPYPPLAIIAPAAATGSITGFAVVKQQYSTKTFASETENMKPIFAFSRIANSAALTGLFILPLHASPTQKPAEPTADALTTVPAATTLHANQYLAIGVKDATGHLRNNLSEVNTGKMDDQLAGTMDQSNEKMDKAFNQKMKKTIKRQNEQMGVALNDRIASPMDRDAGIFRSSMPGYTRKLHAQICVEYDG